MRAERKEGRIHDYALTAMRNYLDHLEERPIFPEKSSLDDLTAFTEPFPDDQTPGIDILEVLVEKGQPATVTQIGGRYFGFVNGSAVPVAQAARWLSAIWDQNAAMYVTSPLVSHLETVVESWLIEIFSLPDTAAMGLVSGTSLATIIGLITGRNHLLEQLGWNINDDGLFGAPQLRVIVSEEVHSSVFKALSIIGLGKGRVEVVPSDEQGRVRHDLMPELDETCLILLQAGNVNTGAFDNFDAVCDQARAAGAWVHVDGAFGLWAASSQDYRHLVKGMQKADSWSVDGHKTLNTPYDCGIVLCRDRSLLVGAMQATGSYLQFSEQRDGMLYVPEMSRSSKGIEVWATLKFLGRSGLSEMVEMMCELAAYCAEELQRIGIEVLNDVVFNQVLVRYQNDEATRAMVDLLQEGRRIWLGSSEWKNMICIRISICSWATTKQDIDTLVREFRRAKDDLVSGNTPK